MKALRLLTLLLLVLTLGACQKTGLHHGLEEAEADEILVYLHEKGIDAEKKKEVSGQDVSWTILVPKLDLPIARRVLVEQNLPRKKELGLSGVYKEKSMISSAGEQHARFLLSLKGEIINSLEKIPEVVDADVVLNVPSESDFALLEETRKRPTASVVLRLKVIPGFETAITEGKIQRFVANAIPEMDPNDVVVVLTRAKSATETMLVPSAGSEGGDENGFAMSAPPPPLEEVAGLRMDPDSKSRFRIYVIFFLFLLVVLSMALIYNVIRLTRLKQAGGGQALAALPPDDSRPIIEGGG